MSTHKAATAQASSAQSVSKTTGNPSKFDISQLPSLQKDGMTVEQEALQRRKTCRFIEEGGRIIKLPRVAMATAMVMFHRFYAKHSFGEHDRFEVAIACIVLAAKTEESPKKLSTVITECYKLKMQGMKAGRISNANTSGQQQSTAASTSDVLDVKGEEFFKLKERILLLERVILHTIGFELSIDHPYKFLVDQIRVIVTKQLVEFDEQKLKTELAGLSQAELTKKMNNRLVQMSMNFANDSLHTSLCLQFDPKEIATACVYLGCNFANLQPSLKDKTEKAATDWIEVLDNPEVDVLASISLQILELIAERKGADMTTIGKIRDCLDKIVKSPSNIQTDTKSESESKRQRIV